MHSQLIELPEQVLQQNYFSRPYYMIDVSIRTDTPYSERGYF